MTQVIKISFTVTGLADLGGLLSIAIFLQISYFQRTSLMLVLINDHRHHDLRNFQGCIPGMSQIIMVPEGGLYLLQDKLVCGSVVVRKFPGRVLWKFLNLYSCLSTLDFVASEVPSKKPVLIPRD